MEWEATIQYEDELEPLSVIFSDVAPEEDDHVFYYINGEHDLDKMLEEDEYGIDGWKLISFESKRNKQWQK